MKKENNDNIKTYSIGKFAELVGEDPRKIRYLDKAGKLVAYRSSTGRRYYTNKHVYEYKQMHGVKREGTCILYARISNPESEYYLKQQVDVLLNLMEYNCITDFKVYTELGFGTDFDRPVFNEIIRECFDGKVRAVYITTQDKLTRVGYGFIKRLLKNMCDVDVISIDCGPYKLSDLISDVQHLMRRFGWGNKTIANYADKLKEREYTYKARYGDAYFDIDHKPVDESSMP